MGDWELGTGNFYARKAPKNQSCQKNNVSCQILLDLLCLFYTETVRDSDRIVRNLQSVRLGHAGRSLRGMSKSDADKLKAEVAELKQQVKEAKAANTLGPDPEKEQMKADMAALKAQVEALAKAMQSQSAAPAPAQ